MRKSIRFLPGLVLIVAGATGAGPRALAVPITYIESATASGNLNGVAFTNQTVVLTMHNDTANVTGAPPVFNNNGRISLRVDALAPVTFSDPNLLIFANQATHTVGFTDETSGNDILDLTNAAFATYDLTTAIGPVSGPSIFIAGQPFPTSGGDFVLTTAGPATFTARLTTTVPEPASLALMGTGLAGLALILRRRRQAV